SRTAAQKRWSPGARSSLCGCALGAGEGVSATRPPDGGDTNSAPSGDRFGPGPSRNRLSNPGRGHDGASNPKRCPAERAARAGPRAPEHSTRTQYLRQYFSYSLPDVVRETRRAKETRRPLPVTTPSTNCRRRPAPTPCAGTDEYFTDCERANSLRK